MSVEDKAQFEKWLRGIHVPEKFIPQNDSDFEVLKNLFYMIWTAGKKSSGMSDASASVDRMEYVRIAGICKFPSSKDGHTILECSSNRVLQIADFAVDIEINLTKGEAVARVIKNRYGASNVQRTNNHN